MSSQESKKAQIISGTEDIGRWFEVHKEAEFGGMLTHKLTRAPRLPRISLDEIEKMGTRTLPTSRTSI